MENKTCCFTGHRNLPAEKLNEIKYELERIILLLAGKGYNRFIAGGALGFDTIAAETVLRLMEKEPELKLEIAVPCPGQHMRFSPEQKKQYLRILESADKVFMVSDRYSRYCMAKRNKYMVDNSDCVVAYLNRPKGGTFNTVSYAEHSGKEVIYLLR